MRGGLGLLHPSGCGALPLVLHYRFTVASLTSTVNISKEKRKDVALYKTVLQLFLLTLHFYE